MSITKLDCMELVDTRYSVYPYDGYNLEEILGKFYEAIKECNDLSFSLQEFNQWLIAEGLLEEVLKQLSKIDWDNVINSELYQKIVEKITLIDSKIELFKNEIEKQFNEIAIIPRKKLDIETDDTLRIQEAINKANKTKGGRIYLPSGIYYVDTLNINKDVARKIIFMGQSQKTDYWNTQNETVQIHSINGNNMFNIEEVTVYFEGISLVGKDKSGIGINAINNGRTSMYKCKVYGFDTGVAIENSIHDIRECEITGNNTGIYLATSGDSCISDCWINTNNVGVSYGQYCANSQIKGGKIEWNEKGIMCLSSGVIIQGIQFDYNKFYDIWVEGGTFPKYAFAVHPDNIFNISIIGNRFLGSGYTDVEVSSAGSCNIWLFKCSEINITSNTFASSGRHAFDNSGLSANEPNYKVAPLSTFIKIRDSIVNVVGNVFNTQYNIPPLMIVDVNKMASRVQYTGNRHTTNREPLIYDFGGLDISGGGNRIYSNVGNISLSKLNKKPTNGTFEVGDIIMDISSSSIQKWVCTEAGTMREKPSVNIISETGNDWFELSGEIDVNHLQVGDYVKIQYEAKKVIRIVYNDGNLNLNNARFYVNGNIETTYNGAIDYYPPTFREI